MCGFEEPKTVAWELASGPFAGNGFEGGVRWSGTGAETLAPTASLSDVRRWIRRCWTQRCMESRALGGPILSIRSIIGQRPVMVFIVLAFVVGWWPWYVGLAPEASPFVPSLLAIILTAIVAGSSGLKRLLRDAVRWRAPLTVWVFALVAQPLLFGVAVGIHVLFGGEAPPFTPFTADELPLVPLYLVIVLLPIYGPVGEELGWRGYAQSRLVERFGPVQVSLVIGAAWGFWHLPDFFADEGNLAQLGLGFLAPFVISTMANSVFMTYLWFRTQGSILIAGIVWHAGTDFWGPLLLSDLSLEAASDDGVLPKSDPTLFAITIVVLAIAAAGLVIATKGKLGFATGSTRGEVSPDAAIITT